MTRSTLCRRELLLQMFEPSYQTLTKRNYLVAIIFYILSCTVKRSLAIGSSSVLAESSFSRKKHTLEFYFLLFLFFFLAKRISTIREYIGDLSRSRYINIPRSHWYQRRQNRANKATHILRRMQCETKHCFALTRQIIIRNSNSRRYIRRRYG